MKKLKFILSFAMLLTGAAAVGAMATSNDVKKVEAAETKTYTLVTSAPSDWSGEYLIVYKESATAARAMKASLGSGIDATGNYQKLTISGDTITASSEYSFIIAKSGSGYSIATNTATKYYIGNTTESKNALKNATSSTTYTNTIKLNTKGDVSIAPVNGQTTLAFNKSTASGSDRFRYYKNSTITGSNSATYPLPYLYVATPDVTETGITVNFDANGGTFADASKWSKKEAETGTIDGLLPTAEDMSATPYKYTELVGWVGGSETYNPGDTYSVSESTTFSAIYKAPELVTLAQALEICGIAGSSQTPYAFTTEGEVVSITGLDSYHQVNVVLTDGTNELLAYGLVVPAELDKPEFEVGYTIRVTGNLKTYNGTAEFNYGCTYEVVSAPAPTLEEKLAEFTTNASVGFSYTKSGEDYTFSNVRLSFRGTISAELYEEVVAAGVTAAGIECSIEGEEPYTIDCSANIGTDAEGNRYVFGSLLVPEGKENIVVTGKAFVTVDGARLYLASTAHSLVSAVSAYLGDNAPTLTAEQLEAVTALAASLGIAA